MRRAVLTMVVLVGLVLISTQVVSACGFAWGQCDVPYGCCYTSYCAPSCYVPCYSPCYTAAPCAPAACQPAQSRPAAPSQAAPAMPPATNPQPTPAPPQPAEQPITLPSLETPPVSNSAKQPAKEDTKVSLPAELPLLPATSGVPKAAEGSERPHETPDRPKAKPIERPVATPMEKPLVAEAEYDNPFVLETDQLQIWTDASGNFRVEARFVSFDQKTVRLQRPSGAFLRVAYDRLSVADRERVQDLSLAVAMKTSMK
ncbi:MAG TPA: SHD1 domain-containing protein [Thermoguttaceae bacterium]|nr:SHD1 domain-containing protein [Thermoguttaceae bacterium]